MKSKNKYTWYTIIQQYYIGCGWEDVSHYEHTKSKFWPDKETKELLNHDLAEYRLMGYATRVIRRKELN